MKYVIEKKRRRMKGLKKRAGRWSMKIEKE